MSGTFGKNSSKSKTNAVQRQTASSTGSQVLDPQTQAFVDQMREMAMKGAGNLFGQPAGITQTPGELASPFMDPYMGQVVDGVRGEFDHLRDQAATGANQQATAAGAFGGDRHGIMAGSRLGALDRAQTSQISGLLSGGFNQAMDRGIGMAQYNAQAPMNQMQQIMQMLNLGMGPAGWQTSNQSTGQQNATSRTSGKSVGISAGFGV